MSRRYARTRIDPFNFFQDPGKDLFAYLFLIMLFFTFMLMTLNATTTAKDGTPPSDPVVNRRGGSGEQGVPFSRALSVFKSKGEIFLTLREKNFPTDQKSLAVLKTKLEDIGSVNDEKEATAYLLFADKSVVGNDAVKVTMRLNNAGITVQFVEEK